MSGHELQPEEEHLPEQPKRVQAFASFFKNYMSISTLVTAALPIPVTAAELIPIYEAQKGILGTYTPLFCFLVLGYIFYMRHSLAKRMFNLGYYGYEVSPGYYSGNRSIPTIIGNFTRRFFFWIEQTFVPLAPLGLILLSLYFVSLYHSSLAGSVVSLVVSDGGYTLGDEALILQQTELAGIPDSNILILSYLGIFVAAESAFVLMAIREYLQDLLRISDVDLIVPQIPKSESVAATSAESADRSEAQGN